MIIDDATPLNSARMEFKGVVEVVTLGILKSIRLTRYERVGLFRLNRILAAEPLTPASFQSKRFSIATVDELLCQTGTCVLIRSSAVKNEGVIF